MDPPEAPAPGPLERGKTWAPDTSSVQGLERDLPGNFVDFRGLSVSSEEGSPPPAVALRPNSPMSISIPTFATDVPTVALSLDDPAPHEYISTFDPYDLPFWPSMPLPQVTTSADGITPDSEYENMSKHRMEVQAEAKAQIAHVPEAQAQILEAQAQTLDPKYWMELHAQTLEAQAQYLRHMKAQNTPDHPELFPFPGGYNPMMMFPPPCPWGPFAMPPMMTPSQGASMGPSSSLDVVGSSAEQTTVMWKNLPNNYTRDQLLELVNEQGFEGHFDFFYAPFDFASQALVGYAFVNFYSHEQANRFWEKFEGFDKWTLASNKKSQVRWSEQQGLEYHIEKYRNSPVMHDSQEDGFKPVTMKDGQITAFPLPTKKIRAPHQKDCRPKQ